MKNNILKSIFVTILLLLGVSHAAWGRTIYLDTSKASDPYNSENWWAHIWDGGSEENKALTKVKDNLYKVEVGDCTKIIFVPNEETGKTWTNQTDNITIPDQKEDKNCYKITGKSTGLWINYQEFSIEGITKSETQSSYAIHMWASGASGTDYAFYKTNKDNYYLATNGSGWDMSTLFGFGFKYNGEWKGGGKITISATDTWFNGVYGDENGTLPNSGMVYAIYFYYDGSTSALFLSTSTSYTVTYNYNGGSGNVASATCAQGETVTLPSPNARDGYTFDGWYTAATEGSSVGDEGASYKPTDNITLYAHWTEKKYTVTITKGEGGSVSPQSVSVGITTGATITATPNTGYDFVNWTASTNQIAIADINAATTTVTATAEGTVTAHFQKKTYTVTFNTNGHGNEVAAQKVTSGETATEPAAPTATGFIFGGWYTEAGCTNKYDFSTAVTKNITLYAKWTEDYSTKKFYYFDEKITGWNGEVGKAMVNAKEYAYIQRLAYNNTDNKFKIFPDNPKGADNTKIANGENIPTEDSPLKGEIKLTAEGGQYNNIKMPSTDKDYYVILYYPNTTTNPSNDFLVAASYSLPNMEKYPLTFGVIGENGNLTAKSGGVSISSGAEVASVTLTAEPTDNYEVEGWYSDAEGNNQINAAGTNTIYNLTLTAATSVYVKFKRIEKTYWYNGSDKGWANGSSDPLLNHESGVYAYYIHDAHSSNEVQFCIFEANSWTDNTPKYNGNHKNNGFYGANIDLGTAGDGNAIVPKQNTDYYIILYFPNTTYNPNDNYILCASTTLPVLSDPVTVSFGVVGKTGGSLIAKSGNSTIESGTAVSYVTFTATPIAGYAVEGWYSDAEGTQQIVAAGTSTTYTLSPVTESNCNVYVKFNKVSAIYFKPNDQNHWGTKMVYMFSGAVWDNDKGVNPNSSSRKEYYAMEKVNDSVYYHTLTYADACSYVAFNWGDQSGNNNFDNCEAIYRGDFSTKLPFYISEKGQGYEESNKHDNLSTKYFNKGVWMAYGEEKSGYSLVLRDPTKADAEQLTDHDFIVDEAYGYTSSVTVALEVGKTYSFQIKNLNNTWYKPESGGLRCSAENHQFTMYEKTEKYEIVIDTRTDGDRLPAGNYTFQLNLVNGKVEVNVLIPTTQYRLVYVEKKGDNTEKYHPSHVIKQRAGGTEKAPLYDTISMHVRPMIRTWNETKNKYDTTENTNTCEVQLQQRNAGTNNWTVVDAQKVDVKTRFTESGVYNFVLKQVGEAVTLPTELIHPYTGQYYILTDAFDSNWSLTAARDNIKQRFWYSNYADNKESFSYYCCKWTDQYTNLKFVVANDYSYCITDTLIRTEYEATHGYVSDDGKLNAKANVRFMWQHYDNTTDRAYIGAGESSVRLISTNSQIKEGAELNLDDQQNWVYAKEVHAQINTLVKIEATYNGYKQYLKGKKGDFNEANTEYLIKGIYTSQPYLIRVIYDFKTNHLICAWMPEGEISGGDQVIESDIMLIRKDTCDATQITFNGANLKSVKTAYGVVELTKAYLENTKYTKKARGNYWISFPFDVNLSDVFGNGIYGTHYLVQYYDGEARAREGQWIDSPTRWKFYRDPTNVVLKKGLGYVLVVLPDKLLNEQFTHGNSSIRFYFPSTNTEPINIDGTVQKVTVPEYKCAITRNNRYIYDSNWNIIGVPTWANRDDMGNPKIAEQEGKWNFKVGFYYKADTSNGKFEASEAGKLSFKSMYAYLVQWAGTIRWTEVNDPISGDVHPNSPAQQALQARRNAAAEEGEEELSAPEQYTLRLTLHRGDQQLDHTYVRLQEGNVTTDFDLNYDMTKIINSGANIYSLVGTQRIQCAANVQPLQEEARTISIPLGVVADQDGLYTFSLPDGTEGMNVSIADSETGMAHNLALGDYQTALTKGTYEGRFALEIQPRQEVSTGCEQTDAAGKSLRKVLINGNLYILRDGKAYTATGNEL